MTLTWPDIPFVGAEVTAFVAAYKELAESIYDNYYEDYEYEFDVTIDSPHLKPPFRNREVIKELLENGLIFSSFIIQQRSGNVGPGIDFDLGNSPFSKVLDSDAWLELGQKLGCIYTKDGMLDALRKNTETTPDDLGDDGIENWLDDLINSLEDVNPDNVGSTPSSPNNQPQPCAPGAYDATLINVFKNVHPDPLMRIKVKITERYTNCNSSPLTENDLGTNEVNTVRDKLNDFLNQNRNRHCTDVTASEGSRYNVQPGKTLLRCNFYNAAGESRGLRTLFGEATFTVNADGTVHQAFDDFDFIYGKELNRTDGSAAGSAYNQSDVTDGWAYKTHGRDPQGNPTDPNGPSAVRVNGVPVTYPPFTEQEALQYFDRPRDIIIRSYFGGDQNNRGGTPVPITLTFSY